MAKLSMSAAARTVGVSRQKLYNDIELKGISVDRSDPKKPTIDTAELLRVYGKLQGVDSPQGVKIRQRLTPENDNGLDRLQAELETLRREKIAALEARADAAEKERDEWRDQAQRLSLLLTDQRQETAAPVPSPIPAVETLPTEAQKPRTGGWRKWLRGE